MKKRPWRTSGHKTKRVITRSMYDHVQGTTVRVLEPSMLPTGCCAIVGKIEGHPYTCTMKMTHVELTTEMRFVPSEKAHIPVVKLLGYCKTHRPKNVDSGLIALHSLTIRKINGTTNVKAKLIKMQNAVFVDIASPGSSTIHAAERQGFHTVKPEANWGENIGTLCGKTLKEAVVITGTDRREDEWRDCKVCLEQKEVVHETS